MILKKKELTAWYFAANTTHSQQYLDWAADWHIMWSFTVHSNQQPDLCADIPLPQSVVLGHQHWHIFASVNANLSLWPPDSYADCRPYCFNSVV